MERCGVQNYQETCGSLPRRRIRNGLEGFQGRSLKHPLNGGQLGNFMRGQPPTCGS